jgi:hypothetical protein
LNGSAPFALTVDAWGKLDFADKIQKQGLVVETIAPGQLRTDQR